MFSRFVQKGRWGFLCPVSSGQSKTEPDFRAAESSLTAALLFAQKYLQSAWVISHTALWNHNAESPEHIPAGATLSQHLTGKGIRKSLGVSSAAEQKISLPAQFLIIFNLLFFFCAVILCFHNFSILFIDLQIPTPWYMWLRNTSFSSVNIRPLHNICAYHLLALNLVSSASTLKMLICEPFLQNSL